MTELEDLKEVVKELRNDLRELEAETRTDYYDNKLAEIEERLDKQNDENLTEAIKYLAMQGSGAPITRADLIGVLLRFKVLY